MVLASSRFISRLRRVASGGRRDIYVPTAKTGFARIGVLIECPLVELDGKSHNKYIDKQKRPHIAP